jgi:hypothetical protein
MSEHPTLHQNLPPTFRCRTHPDREGVGICVSCRAVVCVECSTRVDRMNYCIRCLQSAADPDRDARREDPRAETALGVPLLIGSFILTAGVFALLGFLLALLRQWTPGGVTGPPVG